MATLDSIADEIGYTRNELMQSMVKFGLTNRDWRNEGLTAHKRLPRYQENPDMATKPPSAAQLAARARFAEMARNGSLNRKRQIAAKKRATNPTPKHDFARIGKPFEYDGRAWKVSDYSPDGKTIEAYTTDRKKPYRVEIIKVSDLMVGRQRPWQKPYTNPAKKTVSQKISQLVHEGYPQRQAVAVALNEQRKGKVKRNPAGMVKGYAVVCMHPNPHTVAITTSMAEAKKIGQDYASRENVQVAIKPVDVHAAHFA
jgi:hypothetical protein